MKFDKIAALTFDTDWVPVPLLEMVLEEIVPKTVPGTFFITSQYPCLDGPGKNYEVAPHTNPPSLLESDLTKELLDKLSLCPGQTLGQRSHSLFWTERLRPIFRKHGIMYDSSTIMYLEKDIQPYLNGYNLVELPIFFMDFFHLEYCQLSGTDPFDIDNLHLEEGGLKIFDFHPIHLYLNTPRLDFYASVKQNYHDMDRLSKNQYPGYGIRSFFKDILDKLNEYGYQLLPLAGIFRLYTQTK